MIVSFISFAGFGWAVEPQTGHGLFGIKSFAKIPACSSMNCVYICEYFWFFSCQSLDNCFKLFCKSFRFWFSEISSLFCLFISDNFSIFSIFFCFEFCSFSKSVSTVLKSWRSFFSFSWIILLLVKWPSFCGSYR